METGPAGGAPALLGIDTGGTYTDAVLIDGTRLGEGAPAVIAKAKRLTTRADLARGVGAAVEAVLAESGVAPARVGLVSLSTTLATNALVEGAGGRAGLVAIGFGEGELAREGLGRALGGDLLVRVAGGHDAAGEALAPLDLAALERAVSQAPAGIEAWAICGHFAVRNPAHEQAAAEAIRAATGRPVTCSHVLSARVGGPRRALTALLNARLTGLIDRLIAATARLAAESGIDAPLMVVRGDGALVSAAFARERPVETILSGPAASLVGAGWLTALADAVVSDIGGTTTDVAVLRDGRPRLDPEGARVGGHRTMVEAVAMRTVGLGGDSEVRAGETGDLVLGPRRLVPVSLLAAEAPETVHRALDRQLAEMRTADTAGRFLFPLRPPDPEDRGAAELAGALAEGPRPLDRVLTARRLRAAAARMVARGEAAEAGFTPSDAAHVLGHHAGWDRAAAEKAARLLAGTRGPDGKALAADAAALSRRVVERLTRLSAEHVLETALSEDGFAAEGLARSALARAALDGHAGLVRPSVALGLPLIGLGASAPAYYPGVAALLSTEARIPEHADVANAIGAVVGGVRVSRTGTLATLADGRVRAHLPDGPRDFAREEEALDALDAALEGAVRAEAETAGADGAEIARSLERREAEVEGRRILVEATLTLTAAGRPRLAASTKGATADPLPIGPGAR